MVSGGGKSEAAGAAISSAPAAEPALHVIVLGSGGGPFENNVTSLLVRSVSSNWGKGSVVAVDAGVHMGAIKDILQRTQPEALGKDDDEHSLPHTLTKGPFAGLEVRSSNPGVNAAEVVQDLVDTYVITHCHLDHIAGLVINTAGLRRPKRLAALPITIEGFKKHIFNNVIWPNLSDENNGHGLVTYMRLVEGGSPALGEGETRGYLEIGDGLAVKALAVSHGHCVERHAHRGSISTRHPSFDGSSFVPGGSDLRTSMQSGLRAVNRSLAHLDPGGHNLSPFLSAHQQERATSLSAAGRVNSMSDRGPVEESICVYDSSAYFFQHVPTGREVLIFGDVEPDSESLTPRNQHVWQTAAPKIAAGKLTAIFIECSYDDSVTPDRLYGHLAPRYIQEEMTFLAKEVLAARMSAARMSATASNPTTRVGSISTQAQQNQGRRKSDPELSLSTSSTGSADKKRKREGDGEQEGGIVAMSHMAVKRIQTELQPRLKSPGISEVSDAPISPKTIRSLGAEPPQPDYFLSQHNLSQHVSTSQSHTPHLATPTGELSISEVDAQVFDAEKLERDEYREVSLLGEEEERYEETQGPVTPLSIPVTNVHPASEKKGQPELKGVLNGLKVVIIHVKERLVDGPELAREVIERELRAHEATGRLGVEYIVSKQGDSLFL
ncbi:cAMP phosphodiesterases class-II-domain-containing protein [Cladorrhinum samala]|uniref:cAMP phosphodiesterases class-II-domain-containing protein n=1 Tax=Cladorrhinum samala TaxID=585594 RepID=A0AAV9HW57_9PEZI|nr:cAMP phosphodiesterases class-II-domain-containing protein [Cladorrhinum samala]